VDDDLVKEANQILSAVSRKAWADFQGKISPEEVQRRVAEYLNNMVALPASTKVDAVELHNDMMTVQIKTNDPRVIRELARLNDPQYLALVERIRAFGETNPGGTYMLTPEEHAVALRHMEPPIVVTATVKKDPP